MDTPQTFWGAKAIAKRMQWSVSNVGKAIEKGFYAYPRRKGQSRREMLFTDENLIQAWQLGKVNATIQMYRQRAQDRADRKRLREMDEQDMTAQ